MSTSLKSIIVYYCVNMVSVMSASRYITSVSRYHQRYQSRSSMYIRGLIPWNFMQSAKEVPIAVVEVPCPSGNTVTG